MSDKLPIVTAPDAFADALLTPKAGPRPDVESREKPSLFALEHDELMARLGGPGRVRMVWAAVRAFKDPFAPGVLPKGTRQRLLDACSPAPLLVTDEHVAPDGTRKLLARMADGLEVESVIIPTPGRSTVCISSQVGCIRGCRFCLTATMGQVRNLSCAEIVGQVALARRLAHTHGMPALRNIVFMGMGEPLDNQKAVTKATRILSDNRLMQFAPKHVTVSTVGPSPAKIRSAGALPVRLAWSVHAVDDALRKRLVPTTKHRMVDLRDAFIEALSVQKDRLFIEVTLMDGINDSDAHAEALAAFIAPLPQPVRVNLLPMNPIGDPTLRPSPMARVEAFRQVVCQSLPGTICIIRQTRGDEERAACGQLAVTVPANHRAKKAPARKQAEREALTP